MKQFYSLKTCFTFVLVLSISSLISAQDFNIQHIESDIGNASSTSEAITAVASLNNAFALPTNNRKTHAGETTTSNTNLDGHDLAGARRLTSTNEITYYRDANSLATDMRFNTSIWEYIGPTGGPNEMIVRGRYTVALDDALYSTTIDLAAIGIITPANCIPFITGIMNDAAVDDAHSGTALAYVSDDETLSVFKGGTNDNKVTVYITLVEFTGSNWTVLHGDSGTTASDSGTITLNDNADGTSGITAGAASWNEAIIFGQHIGDTAATGTTINNAIADNWPVFSANVATPSVDWSFHSNHVSNGRHFVHVLSNSDLNVTRYSDNTSNSSGETTIALSSALKTTDEAFVVGSSTSSGGGNAYARGWRNYYLKDINTVAHWSHRSGNAMKHEIQVIDLSGMSSFTYPGGIANDLELWLKADTGVEVTASNPAEDLDRVRNWIDNSAHHNDATQTLTPKKPIFTENAFNFNPSLDFNGTNHEMTASTSANNQITIFAVAEGTYNGAAKNLLHLDNGTNGSVEIEHDGTASLRGRYTNSTPQVIVEVENDLTSTNSGTPYLVNYRHLTGTTSSDKSELFINGIIQTIPPETGANTLSGTLTAGIGANVSKASNHWDGGIAEMIVYNYKVPTADRVKIESYLAIKYGLTLGVNGTSQDYVDSDGRVIWDIDTGVAADDNFNNNVTGLGFDSTSSLNQKQSKSVYTPNDITIGIKTIETTNSLNTTSFFADKTFLMWGHDAGGTGAAPAITKDYSSETDVTSSASVTPITQKWKLVVTDSIPTIKLSIPESMVSSTKTGRPEYVMIVSDTEDFASNVTSVTMEMVGANLEVDFYFEGTKYITFGSTAEVVLGDRSAYFDNTGSKDAYLDAGNVNDLANKDFTISAWIKRDVGQNKFDIVSKRNYYNEGDPGGDTYTHGYAFRINQSSKFRMVWRNPEDTKNSILETAEEIPENEWHHVAATYDFSANEAILYIDGIHVYDSADYLEAKGVAIKPMNAPSDSHFLIGSAHHILRQQKMRGSIDEVRVWDVALSANQLRYVMNQEIKENGTLADGKVLPAATTNNEIKAINWNNLIAYYPMSTIVFGSIKDESNSRNDASMINYKSLEQQTAPLPYKSIADGAWDTKATWENGAVQYLPGVISYLDANETIDYNIVQINDNVTMGNDDTALIPEVKGKNRTVLGLIVQSDGDLQIDGDTSTNAGNGLTVSHYLKIDGTLDLEGESQLIQITGSDFDPSSTGSLERDQQGTINTYRYNYWSSPVSPTSNTDYSADDIFKTLGFINSAYNGTMAPLKNADYWIWKYANNPASTYSAWQHIRSTGSISAGQGFTMKGPGTGTGEQNYEFVGQPNNGDISLTLSKNYDYLVGNPYPSAIDADAFIKDNIKESDGGTAGNTINAINGTLYFWEHFSDNTHILAEYQGGYAAYTLMGGALAINNDVRINTLGGLVATKTPERYIAVGQGFFVSAASDETTLADVDGGTVVFKNSQRVFKKESASGDNSGSVFLRSNSNETIQPADTRQKIRLMFDSPDGYHRQLLVGVDQNATNDFDLAYDGALNETNNEDMYWTLGATGKLVIQAVNDFNEDQVLPLGLKINTQGTATIRIDDLKNISNTLNIYLHDIELDYYHNLRESDYSIVLESGAHLNRFEITFSTNEVTLSLNDEVKKDIDIMYYNDIEKIVLINPNQIEIKAFELFTILGQSIQTINEISENGYSEYEVTNLNTGAYIIRLHTASGAIVTKKILVK